MAHQNVSSERSRILRAAKLRSAHPEPVMIRLQSKASGTMTVSFQWYDGAGEMHCLVLDPDASQAYIHEEVLS